MKKSKSFSCPEQRGKASVEGNVISTNGKVEPSTYMGFQKKISGVLLCLRPLIGNFQFERQLGILQFSEEDDIFEMVLEYLVTS